MTRPVGRPTLLIPNTTWKVRVPEPLALIVDSLCFDPLRNKLKFGDRSAYVTSLIRRDLVQKGILPEDFPQREDFPLTTSTNGDMVINGSGASTPKP